jgi:hypothetical protein
MVRVDTIEIRFKICTCICKISYDTNLMPQINRVSSVILRPKTLENVIYDCI